MEYRVCRNNPAPYNDLNGKISLLGLGTMRLPLRDAADQTSIDEEKAQEIFDYAYAHGVNYFDTAYPYHGGMSEKFCGKALAKYPRASYHLASKLPGWLLKCDEDVPRIFNEQLANCRTDYFDFYLVHSVHESSWSNYVKYHAYDQLNELRKAGKIKRLGFSFHGSAEQLPEILAAGDWDFVQLQLNYFDWDYQQSRKKYELCAAAGLQNCCTASPDTSPRAAALAAPNTARSAGLSLNSRVVMPLQESTCGASSVRRQICPTSPASAASSCGVNRVRGRVTAAWVRPRSSSVTAHSCGGAPSPVKNSATRLDL